MYTIKLAEGSSNKLTDTTEFLKLLLLKDSLAFPVTGYTVTFKIGNDSGYLVDVPVDVLRSNEVAISTQSDTFKLLSPDTYQFEVWAEKDNERVIFPTNGTGEFTISDNITGFNGKMISSVTVNEFLAKVKTTPGAPGESAYQVAVNAGFHGNVNQWLASLVGAKGDKGDTGPQGGPGPMGLQGPKGDKGDTGTVDNAGLTAAPAFVELQTQFNNSAVGTNLLTGTTNKIVTGSGPFTNGYLSNETNDNFLSLLQGLKGETVTVSADYKYQGFVKGSGQNRLGWEVGIITGSTTRYHGPWYYADSSTNSSGSGRISGTFVVPENITGIESAYGYIQFSGSGTGTVSQFKLEKGSVATDWRPNPAEILTQADYAKIQAAIVALGGSLS